MYEQNEDAQNDLQNFSATKSTCIGRLSIQTPVFHKSNLSLKFGQMESHIKLAPGITKTDTNFQQVLAALPKDMALNLPKKVTTDADVKNKSHQPTKKPNSK